MSRDAASAGKRTVSHATRRRRERGCRVSPARICGRIFIADARRAKCSLFLAKRAPSLADEGRAWPGPNDCLEMLAPIERGAPTGMARPQ